MAFSTLANSGVDTAFRLMGDLGENITFSNVETEDYNFSEDGGVVEQSFSLEQTLRCLVTKQYAISDPNPRLKIECIIKSSDVSSDELDNYDIVSLRSKNWTIDEFEDDNYTISLKLSRKT